LARLPVVVRIELQPMDEGEVVQLFTAIRVYLPQPGKAEAIVARSEGNPFYVEELLAAGDPAQPGMSSSLRDILAARLDNLPESAKEVLRRAAAAGAPCRSSAAGGCCTSSLGRAASRTSSRSGG
jgi:predicted ATPase